MSFKISGDKALGESIRCIACDQIDAAIAASRSARNGKSSPVHETRKHLKKARAALRLLAAEVNPEPFRKEDRRLRSVGRLISNIRDAEVRLETVHQLRQGLHAPQSKSFKETEELLAFELDSFLAAFAGWQDEAAGKLKRAQGGIARWRLHKLTRDKICCTVRESYRKGREALARARKRGTATRFHELRKRAKELWYQLLLLRPLEPAVFCALSDDLKTLGEHLGHAHDLCFVAERLQSIGRGVARKHGNQALEAVIHSREQELLQTARALGERFYAVKPKEFSARIADYFDERERRSKRESWDARSVRGRNSRNGHLAMRP